MSDLPLHPIVVHFPIAVGMLLPVFGLGFWLLIRTEVLPKKAWIVVTALALFYLGTAFMAEEMGERDEGAVERVVGEEAMKRHEEAGERMPAVAGVIFLFSIVPLLLKNKEFPVIAFVVASALGTLPLVHAGHTGGELVYVHGAAQAHMPASPNAPAPAESPE